MAADFGALQTPNFTQAALGGYQAGQAIAKQRQLDTALGGIDLSRPESLLPILRADPSTGAALIGASVKIHAEDRAQQTQAALGNALGGYFGGGSSSSSSSSGSSGGSAPAMPTISPSPTPANPMAASAPSDASNPSDIVVTAPHPVTQMAPNLQQTVGKLLQSGVPLDQATQFVDLAGKMTKAQADASTEASTALASVGQAAASLPYEQRKAYIQSRADYLAQHGVTPDHINNFDPTDDGIKREVTNALGLKDAIAVQHQNDEFGLQKEQFAHTIKHDTVLEGQGQQRIGLEGANVAIARGHLSLAQQAGARAATAAKAKTTASTTGGIATPTSAAEYDALPSGARFYKNGTIRIKQ